MRTRFCGTNSATVLAIALFGATVGRPMAVRAESDLRLSTVLSNATLVVIWNDPAALLQRAPSVIGTWVTVSNAVSPYRVPASNTAAFFRLLQDCVSLPGVVSWWAADGTANDLIGTNNGTLMWPAGCTRQARCAKPSVSMALPAG
jgi:hypothetical protein